ncbi:RND family efflux transporter [Tessaracoccus caeni]|uniref:hypothetical protein n=1 Tax=Tessaracoccus caeni TaxID=3031239 RepID=UPI0023DAC217|nr:hypothetical protein [Tessaracoccus caeni]MDF1487794.1 hypothetical protein [Tessaracoccus caeni]
MSDPGRVKGLLTMVIVSLLSLGVGVGATFFIKSPAQEAAEREAPPPTTLTEPVQLGTVQQTLTAAVQVERRSTTTVATRAGDVVTGVPVANGDIVEAGSVLLEVGGRPVIALRGKIAHYRDITPGMSGPDVTQLIKALRKLKLNTGSEKSFGPKSQAAVEQLYEQLGYEATTVGIDELDAAQQAAKDAKRGLRDANRAYQQARTSLERARRALPADATDDDKLARKDAIADAEIALEDAGTAVTDAESAEKQARDEVTKAQHSAGVTIPATELVFVPAFPATAKVIATLGASAGGDALSLVSGPLVAVASVPESQGRDLAKDQAAGIITSDGQEAPATVTSVELQQGTDPQSEQPVSVWHVVLTPDPELPDAELGQELRARVQVRVSDEEVLHVPVTAVSTAMDGTPQVSVLAADGERVTVPVATGLQGDGRVQVTPTKDGGLREGDQVIIGG